MTKNFQVRYLERCWVVLIISALACVPAASSNFARLVTEVREQHSHDIHPEFVTVRDRRGHLTVSGRVGSDPGSPAVTRGTVTVEVRGEDGRLVREAKGCFRPEFEPNLRHTMLEAKPPSFDVELGEGYTEPMIVVVRVEDGPCTN